MTKGMINCHGLSWLSITNDEFKSFQMTSNHDQFQIFQKEISKENMKKIRKNDPKSDDLFFFR